LRTACLPCRPLHGIAASEADRDGTIGRIGAGRVEAVVENIEAVRAGRVEAVVTAVCRRAAWHHITVQQLPPEVLTMTGPSPTSACHGATLAVA
jgi:hypothetical protein